MPIWLIFATLVTIGVTALLVALLYRINLPAERARRDRGGGAAVTLADGGGAQGKTDASGDAAEGGGGDGGGD